MSLASPAASDHYRFRHLARMEWIKLRTLRSVWLTMAVAVAAATGIAVAVGRGTRATGSNSFVTSSLVGMLIGVLIAGVLGVLAMTGEYSSGTIATTLAAAPHRARVLAAKSAVLGAVALIGGEVAAFGSFLAGRLAVPHGVSVPTLGDPGVLRAVLLTGTSLSLIGLLGLGLGAIIRNTAVAASVLVAVVYVGGSFAGLLTPAVRAFLPIYIIANSLSEPTSLCRPGAASCQLPPWESLGMLALYAATALILGGCVLARRDA